MGKNRSPDSIYALNIKNFFGRPEIEDSKFMHLSKKEYTYKTSAKACFIDCSLRVEMT